MLLGFTFLGIKAVDVPPKFEERLFPGVRASSSRPTPPADRAGGGRAAGRITRRASVAAQPKAGRPAGTSGIFLLDLLRHDRLTRAPHRVGAGLLAWALEADLAGRFGPAYHDPVECVGRLLCISSTIVWIFLFRCST